jgi:hypothetical protein
VHRKLLISQWISLSTPEEDLELEKVVSVAERPPRARPKNPLTRSG